MGGRSVSSQPLKYLRKMAESISEIADLVAMVSPSQNLEDFRLRTPELSGDVFLGHRGHQAAPTVVSSVQPVQILRRMAESINNIADQEEPLPPAAVSSSQSLEILRKVAESMSNIAGLAPTTDLEEPLHSGESMSPPKESIPQDSAVSVTSLQSHEILQQVSESMSNITGLTLTADGEEPVLTGDSMSFPNDEHIALPSSGGFDRERFQLAPSTPLEPHSETICRSPGNNSLSVTDGFQLAPSTPLRTPMELSAVPLNETGIPDEVVIAFVEEMKRAHEFLLVRDHIRDIIKHRSIPFTIDNADIISTVYCENKLHLFNLKDIQFFLMGFMAEVRGHRHRYINDPYACSNPIFYLLFQTREEGYVLDKNPRAELEKLRKLTPLFYRDSLVRRESHVDKEARTVTLRNVSPSASVKDIWRFFRSSRVEHIEIHSAHESQIAYMTFDSSYGARSVGQRKTFVGSEKISCKSKPLLVQMGSVQDASGAESVEKKVKDVSSMLVEALNEYDELHTYYSQFQSNDLKAYKKEECLGASYRQEYRVGYDESYREGECWKYCGWMQGELQENGGYTVGGCLLHPTTFQCCGVWPPDLWASLSF